jgi:hypothetical protein
MDRGVAFRSPPLRSDSDNLGRSRVIIFEPLPSENFASVVDADDLWMIAALVVPGTEPSSTAREHEQNPRC